MAGRFQPHRSPDADARIRHMENALAAMSQALNRLGAPALAAKNTGNAGVATGGSSGSSGGTAVLAGDVTGPESNTVVQGIEAVPLSGAPDGGDDGKFIQYSSTLGAFIYAFPEVNSVVTLATAAARTVTFTSGDKTNSTARGIQVILNVTVASGTGGLTVEIDGKASLSGAYYSLGTALVPVTTTGTFVYVVHPDALTTTPGITVAFMQSLPLTYRAKVTHGDASSYSYSLEGNLTI